MIDENKFWNEIFHKYTSYIAENEEYITMKNGGMLINSGGLSSAVSTGWSSEGNLVIYSSKFVSMYPEPNRVIFNDPATIVYWNDGTKTVVKCSDNEEFSEEFGLAMSFVKKMCPNRSKFLKYVEKAYRKPIPKEKTDSNENG